MGLGGFIIAAISFIRTINALGDIIREKKPPGRSMLFSDGKPWRSDVVLGNSIQGDTVFRMMVGATVLDLPDERYRRLLWTARKWLIICAALWMGVIIAIGWFFQNS